MSNEWAIMDDMGIIEQGSEDEVKAVWDKLQLGVRSFGDLRLIEIHEVKR